MNFKRKKIFDLSSFSWSHFPKATSPKMLERMSQIGGFFLIAVLVFVCYEVYAPLNNSSHETITYIVQKGWSDNQIAKDLKNFGIIRSEFFFKFYAMVSFQHSSLQAGKYSLSSRMSVYQIVKQMASGNVIRQKILVYEGWAIEDIGNHLEAENVCAKGDFIKATEKDYSLDFGFLKDLPRDKAGKPTVNLEGYLFPDTYYISEGETCDEIVEKMLRNFDKKLTFELRQQISDQKKTIFDVITTASLIEKEVRTLEDKKIVSGILWKRLDAEMPLQLDCTVNYVTGKSDPGVAIKDTKIDSPYNTYKYKGLPKGPISNPGMNSIIAALNPTKTAYWFYLTDGVTHFSKTAEEHAAKKAKYLD